MKTSDCAASLSRISAASGRLRSSTRLRLLRLSATKLTLSPLRIGGVARAMSPFGGSTLMTSAPMSASSVPHNGPAMKLASSITLMPASGFAIDVSLPARIANEAVTISITRESRAMCPQCEHARAALLRAGEVFHFVRRRASATEKQNHVEGRHAEASARMVVGRRSAAVALLAIGQGPARAEWPERTITIVAHFAPGGSNDLLARLIA